MNDQVKDQWTKTACILCSLNCGIAVKLDGRRIARVARQPWSRCPPRATPARRRSE